MNAKQSEIGFTKLIGAWHVRKNERRMDVA